MDAINRNSEGYSDPTAGMAIRLASNFGYRPIVYICSPYRGDTEENVKRARRYSRYAVDKGYIPIAPHLLLPQYMNEETERDLAIFMDLVILKKCEELWVFGDRITEGMKIEINRATKKSMKIRYINEEDALCTKY